MSPTDEFPHDDEHKTDAGDNDWISNEPPVDDFGDHTTEEATVSESDEQAHDDQTSGTVVIEQKKKSPLLLVGGAIVGLGLVAGIGYWQFGGHKQEQPSLLDMASQGDAPQSMGDMMKPAASSPTPAANTTAAAAPAAPPPVAPTTAFGASTAPDMSAMMMKPAAQQSGSTTPDTATPSLPPSAAMHAVSSAVPTPSASDQSIVSNAASDARITALSSRIDDLQKSLGQATQQMSQIAEKLSENQIPPAPSATAAAAAPDAATTERLNKLEQKLTQIEEQHATSTPAVPATHYASSDETAPSHTTHHKHAVKTTKAHVIYRPHPSAHIMVVPAVVAAPASNWVLRAATPDEAWVAKSPTSRELRPVHVGDDLPGVGKIVMIRQDGDSWTVQGTGGVIH